MANSTQSGQIQKPEKPSDDFPLFPHASGRWAKKVRGKFEYFGPWRSPDEALAEWDRVKDELLAGRPRPPKPDPNYVDAYSVKDICDLFLEHREAKVDAGELKQRTWDEYEDVCKTICHVWGKIRLADDIKPADFMSLRKALEMGQTNGKKKRPKRNSPKTVHNLIGRCLAVINFANKNALTDRPIRPGTYFERPSAKELREDRASQVHMGEMMLEASQIKDVLALANLQLKAMTLLAINVGMGNEDCARLEFRHLDLKSGWLDYPRPKTSIKRRAKLWPETIQALNEVVEKRKQPRRPDLKPYVFLTKYGQTWFKEGRTNPISHEFRKLLKDSGHYVTGISFYSLRRTFETIACETKDQAAVDLSMGHEGRDMATLYRQRLGDKRLEAVAKHVRKWLYGKRAAK